MPEKRPACPANETTCEALKRGRDRAIEDLPVGIEDALGTII